MKKKFVILSLVLLITAAMPITASAHGHQGRNRCPNYDICGGVHCSGGVCPSFEHSGGQNHH